MKPSRTRALPEEAIYHANHQGQRAEEPDFLHSPQSVVFDLEKGFAEKIGRKDKAV